MPSFLLTLSALRISALVLLLYSIRVSKKIEVHGEYSPKCRIFLYKTQQTPTLAARS